MRRKLRSIFCSLGSPIRSFREYPERFRYIFKYYCNDLPYIPLPLILGGDDIIPIALHNYMWSTNDYMTMLTNTTSMNKSYLTQRSTMGNKWFATGPGCLYSMPNKDSDIMIPIFVMALSQNRYSNHTKNNSIQYKSYKENLFRDKMYMEVFFHHDIRSVNSTLWRYIRNFYIPLLQLEGIRFQFKSPNEIMDLTTTTYKKPKFTSLEEMKEYKEEISSMSSLKCVFEETGILEA